MVLCNMCKSPLILGSDGRMLSLSFITITGEFILNFFFLLLTQVYRKKVHNIVLFNLYGEGEVKRKSMKWKWAESCTAKVKRLDMLNCGGFGRCRRSRRQTVVALLLSFLLIYLFGQTLLIACRDFTYVTRPIWDSPPIPPNTRVSHFHASNLSKETLCSLHGWKVREKPPRVIDAFIFSIELDLLEIRMKELWDVVDLFVVAEADKTFTGRNKPLFFNDSKKRFSWAEKKLAHFIIQDLSSSPKKHFENEANSRIRLAKYIKSLQPNENDLIIVGDVDELPYSHTIDLLKSCRGYPPEIYLDLQNYLYSFEFRLPTQHCRQHVTTFDSRSFRYHHGNCYKKEKYLLADAGWHCSFCFPHISDFVFKMTSYSHFDRVTTAELLRKENIQQKICDGTDIFDMLPEVYTFRDLMVQWGNVPKTYSTVGIPEYVVQHPERFRYLLPGGCVREDVKNSNDQH